MQLADGKDKTVYFECCGDFSHISRFHYDYEMDEVYFNFRLVKFPGPYSTYKLTCLNGKAKWWSWVGWKLNQFGEYFRNIKWAILGRPVWFMGDGVIDHDEVPKLLKFLEDCRNARKDQVSS